MRDNGALLVLALLAVGLAYYLFVYKKNSLRTGKTPPADTPSVKDQATFFRESLGLFSNVDTLPGYSDPGYQTYEPQPDASDSADYFRQAIGLF